MAHTLHLRLATAQYDRAVMRARFADLRGRMTGETTDLVRFDEVAQRVGARQQIPKGVQSVPLEHIIGSVGRTRDFTKHFLPRPSVNQRRWAKICKALDASKTLPPVELLRIGEVYFVEDGHHRISAARALGQLEIDANVVEVQSPVWLTVEDFQRSRWIAKANQSKKKEIAMEVIEIEVIKSDQEGLERRLSTPPAERAHLVERLLEWMGNRLIAFGTQLKANSHSTG